MFCYRVILLITLLVGTCYSEAKAQSAPALLPPPSASKEVFAPPPAVVSPALPSPSESVPIETTPLNNPVTTEEVAGEPIPANESVAIKAVKPAPKWYHLAYWFGPTPWDIGFELGINGAEGINEALSFRTGGHLKRETEFWKFDTSLVYNKNTANSVETQNNALLDVRIDRKLADSPWSLFFLNQELYDEFQAFDIRVSANTGIGYQLIDVEHKNLTTRFGFGASREFGGPDESTAFEALFGMEYDHELSKTQRLSAKADYFPEWENFSLYRVVVDVGWEIDLDQPSNASLKFSVIDRYDSTPNGVNPNEVNYSVLLIWGI